MSVTIVIGQPGTLVQIAPGVWTFVPAGEPWSDGTLFSDATGWVD